MTLNIEKRTFITPLQADQHDKIACLLKLNKIACLFKLKLIDGTDLLFCVRIEGILVEAECLYRVYFFDDSFKRLKSTCDFIILYFTFEPDFTHFFVIVHIMTGRIFRSEK